ncbi:MAG: SHOCT domain-containing protein [Proteobacteria bacterium]|nr:SHOCT domain-containing protein [Pseudomonadota bacterium]MDA1064216.1 SHOCT domain-containing protein [Pseudomonadota bacterium]
MAREARQLGADALINLQASQRFKGPLPWRITSPTGDGQAVKVLPDSPKIDCLYMGGRLLGPDGAEIRTATREVVSEEVALRVESTKAEIDADLTAGKDPAPRMDLYRELLKLDDLRKQGILTDAEFEAEKKKLLDKN